MSSNKPLKIYPPSLNWYLPSILDLHRTDNILFFGSKNKLYLLALDTFHYVYHWSGHGDRINGVKIRNGERGEKERNGREVSYDSRKESDQSIPYYLSVSSDKTVKLWNSKYDCIFLYNNDNEINNACWSNNIVIFTDKKSINIWNYDLNSIKKIPTDSNATCIDCSITNPDLFVAGFQNGAIILYSIATGNKVNTFIGHEDIIQTIIFSKRFNNIDNNIIISGSRDRSIKIWNINDETPIKKLLIPSKKGGHNDKYWMTICCSSKYPDTIYSSGSDNEILSWSLTSGKSTTIHSIHSRPLFNLINFNSSYNEDTLLSFSLDRNLISYNIAKKSPILTLPTFGSILYGLDAATWSPNKIAIATGDKSIGLIDSSKVELCSVNLIWKGVQSDVTAVVWHPHIEGILAFGTVTGRVGIINTSTDNLISVYNLKSAVYQLQFEDNEIKPDENLLESNKKKKNVNISNAVLYVCSESELLKLKYSNNELILDSSFLNNIKDAKSKLIRTSFAWSSCNQYLIVGYSEGTIELYTNFEEKLELNTTIKNQTKRIYKLSWSPHTQSNLNLWFATASEDTTVVIYSVSFNIGVLECVLIHKLIYHVATVYNISWCHYNPLLLSTNSLDQSAVVWWLGEKSLIENAVSFDEIIKSSPHSNVIEISPLYILPHAGRVLYSLFSSNVGEILTTTDEQLLKIWDLKECNIAVGDVKNEYVNKKFTKKKRQDVSNESNLERKNESETLPVVTTVSVSSCAISKSSELSTEVKSKKKRELVHFPSYPANIDRKYEMISIIRVLNSLYDKKLNLFDSDSFEETGDDILPISIFQTKEKLNIYFAKLLNSFNAMINSKDATAENYTDFNENPIKLRKLLLQYYIWSGDYASAFEFATANGLLNSEVVLLTVQLANPASYGPQIDTSSPFLQSSLQVYAKQLGANLQIESAVNTYLAAGLVESAINVYLAQGLFADAAILALLRFFRDDSVLLQLYLNWAEHSKSKSYIEFSARCFIAAKLPINALNELVAQHYRLARKNAKSSFEMHDLVLKCRDSQNLNGIVDYYNLLDLNEPILLKTAFFIARKTELDHHIINETGVKLGVSIYEIINTSDYIYFYNAIEDFKLFSSIAGSLNVDMNSCDPMNLNFINLESPYFQLFKDLFALSTSIPSINLLKVAILFENFTVSYILNSSIIENYDPIFIEGRKILQLFPNIEKDLLIMLTKDLTALSISQNIIFFFFHLSASSNDDCSAYIMNSIIKLYSNGFYKFLFALLQLLSKLNCSQFFGKFKPWLDFMYLYQNYNKLTQVDIGHYSELLVFSDNAQLCLLSHKKQLLLSNVTGQSNPIRYDYPNPVECSYLLNINNSDDNLREKLEKVEKMDLINIMKKFC